MNNPMIFFNDNRSTLIEIHISDLHFGAPNVLPKDEYNILMEQFIYKIYNINFNILSINGDIFHKKFPSNSDTVMYALKFVNQCVQLCKEKNATLIILHGTGSHDADQIKLFKTFYDDPMLDLRIVEHTQFVYTKGAKILCIPEEYNKGELYYKHFLFEYGLYDTVFMHGTFKGSIYGANEETLNSTKAPIFSMNHFSSCRGPIIAGHVHIASCYEKYFYYTSNPIRFQHGEEEDKGFMIVLHDLKSGYHYVNFEPVESFKYKILEIDDLKYSNPNDLIQYLNELKMNGIDYIKVKFKNIPKEYIEIIKATYKSNNYFSFEESNKEELKINTTKEIEEKYSEMGFLLDDNLSEYEKFVRYINFNKGKDYITIEKLKEILSGAL